MTLDRLGNQRCEGYRREDFKECPLCKFLPTPWTGCPTCGGYGEYPKPSDTPTDQETAK